MEINITKLVFDGETWDLAGSVATHGSNAARMTYQNALAAAEDSPILDTEEKLDALRDHMRGYGAWENSEIDEWTAQKCNAIFLQHVTLTMREMGLEDDPENFDWDEYEADEGAAHDIFKGSDGEIYISIQYC